MTTDKAFIKKREELKLQLAAGEYRTLIDVLFERMSKVIQATTRNPHPVSPWYSSLLLYLVILVVTVTFLLRETSSFLDNMIMLAENIILLAFTVGYLGVVSTVVGNIYIHSVFTMFKDYILDAAESMATLIEIEKWLTSVCNQKIHLIISIVGGAMVGNYMTSVFSSIAMSSIPIGIVIGTLIIGAFGVAFTYMLFYMVTLSARIGRYRLNLYIANPGNSEVIRRMAGLLSSFVYLVAVYGALLILATALSDLLNPFGTVVVALFWIPMIAMFFLNQSSLSSIIQRAKWKTLNEIQEKVEAIHLSKKLGEKNSMETIKRLMDYYDRIENTRSYRIDSGEVFGLLNSLLLPLLALVLGNIDKILELFK